MNDRQGPQSVRTPGSSAARIVLNGTAEQRAAGGASCDQVDNDCDGVIDGANVGAACGPIQLTAGKSYRPAAQHDAEIALDHTAEVKLPGGHRAARRRYMRAAMRPGRFGAS
jgi:hypothetical protein